jgi:hypothetical protein
MCWEQGERLLCRPLWNHTLGKYFKSMWVIVVIGGHPPIPLAQNRGFHLGIFSTTFQVVNFCGRFEALNKFFWAHHSHTVGFIKSTMEKCVILRYTFQMSYSSHQTRLYAKVTPLGSWHTNYPHQGPQTFWCFIFQG